MNKVKTIAEVIRNLHPDTRKALTAAYGYEAFCEALEVLNRMENAANTPDLSSLKEHHLQKRTPPPRISNNPFYKQFDNKRNYKNKRK